MKYCLCTSFYYHDMKYLKILFIALFFSVFAFSAYKRWTIHEEYQIGSDAYSKTAETYITPNPKGTRTQSDSGTQAPIEVDFESLCDMNSDIIGWLYSEDTPINYPVLQGRDNEVYLHTLPDRTNHKNGSLFVDYRCKQPFEEGITVIYGHHMKDSSMFGSLKGYQEQSYYEAHPVMWLLTPEQSYELQLVAGYVTDTNDSLYYFDDVSFESDELLKEANEKSMFSVKNNEKIKNERIIVLSTCSYEADNARFVVWGVLHKK